VRQFVEAPHEALGAAEPRFACAPQTGDAPPAAGDDAVRAQGERTARALAAIWRDLFDGRGLAHDDNLFEAGATSFDVVRFVDAAHKAGFAIAIDDVFAAPDFAGLGRRLARQSLLAEGPRGVPAINQ
jgi:hypothetical protein